MIINLNKLKTLAQNDKNFELDYYHAATLAADSLRTDESSKLALETYEKLVKDIPFPSKYRNHFKLWY